VYYWLLRLSWAWYFTGLLLVYVTLAFLYTPFEMANFDAFKPPMKDYGHLYKFNLAVLTGLGDGGYQDTDDLYLYTIFCLMSLTKIIVFSTNTSLIFARFARPVARVEFSKKILITQHRGERKLMFRVLNLRKTTLVNTNLSITMSITEPEENNTTWRAFYDLKLVRTSVPVFSLPFTFMHIVAGDSKLAGHTEESLIKGRVTIFATFSAVDPVFGSSVWATHHWDFDKIEWDTQFESCFGSDADGKRTLDLDKLSRTVSAKKTLKQG